MRPEATGWKLDIVNGPGATSLLLRVALPLLQTNPQGDPSKGLKTTFTVTSQGSTHFKANLLVCTMSEQRGDQLEIYFTGIYRRKLVEGLYSLRTRKGYFEKLL